LWTDQQHPSSSTQKANLFDLTIVIGDVVPANEMQPFALTFVHYFEDSLRHALAGDLTFALRHSGWVSTQIKKTNIKKHTNTRILNALNCDRSTYSSFFSMQHTHTPSPPTFKLL
jgi:hypothetical protein